MYVRSFYVRKRSVRRNATTRRVVEKQFVFGNGQATVQSVWSSMDLRYVCNGNAKQFEGETTTNERNENRVRRRFYLAFEHLCQLRKENKQRKQCKRRHISHRLVVAISLPYEHHHLQKNSRRTRLVLPSTCCSKSVTDFHVRFPLVGLRHLKHLMGAF